MSKSSNTTKILLGISIACTLVVAGIYTFFFVSMKNKTESVVSLASQLNEFSGAQQRYVSAASALQNEQKNIDKLSAYFVKESEIVAFTKKIEALGPQSGTVISIQSLDPVTTSGSSPFLNFKITGEGKFTNVQRLLVLLQNFPGKFEWKSVRVYRGGGILSEAPIPGARGTKLVRDTAPVWSIEASLSALNFVTE